MTPSLTAAPLHDGEALRRACRDLGLGDDVADALTTKLLDPASPPPVVEPATRREVEMMQLLGTPAVDRLVHDLRNVLNELCLLKAAADL